MNIRRLKLKNSHFLRNNFLLYLEKEEKPIYLIVMDNREIKKNHLPFH